VDVAVVLCVKKGFGLSESGIDTNPTSRRAAEELRFFETRAEEPVVDSLDCRGRRCKSLCDLLCGPVLFEALVMRWRAGRKKVYTNLAVVFALRI